MAWEQDLFTIPGAQAATDLSTKQFYCVKKNSTDYRFALCAVDGEIFDGVLQDKPDTAGDACEVRALGVTKVIAGEALTAGDLWGTDSSGKAKKIEPTQTGADIRDYFAGRVLVGASANEYAVVTIGFPTGIVPND